MDDIDGFFVKIIMDLQDALLSLRAENVQDANQLQLVANHHDVNELLEIPWQKLVTPRWHFNFEQSKDRLMSLPNCTLAYIRGNAQQFYCFLRNQLTTCSELTQLFTRKPDLVNKFVVEITCTLITTFRGVPMPDATVFVETVLQNLMRVPVFWNPNVP